MAADHQSWRENAKCRTLPLEEVDQIFFVGRGGKSSKAKSFCSGCPVQRQCLNYALFYNEDGIWGGLTEKERRLLSPMIGILTTVQMESIGVSTSETRDHTQWGMSESQIQQDRKKYRKQTPYPSEPLKPNPLPLMLVVEL